MVQRLLVATVVVWASGLTHAASSACPELYPPGNPVPLVTSSAVELCNSFYVAHYDQATMRTVIVSERLQPNTPIGDPPRVGAFRADSRVRNSPSARSYVGSNWDKGHLASAEDSSTRQEMYDTFYLTNAVPQDPSLNRGKWKQLEADLRAIAVASKVNTYIITIPIYTGNDFIDNRIPIPSGLWKVLISGPIELYFFADNRPNATVRQYYKITWKNLVQP